MFWILKYNFKICYVTTIHPFCWLLYFNFTFIILLLLYLAFYHIVFVPRRNMSRLRIPCKISFYFILILFHFSAFADHMLIFVSIQDASPLIGWQKSQLKKLKTPVWFFRRDFRHSTTVPPPSNCTGSSNSRYWVFVKHFWEFPHHNRRTLKLEILRRH